MKMVFLVEVWKWMEMKYQGCFRQDCGIFRGSWCHRWKVAKGQNPKVIPWHLPSRDGGEQLDRTWRLYIRSKIKGLRMAQEWLRFLRFQIISNAMIRFRLALAGFCGSLFLMCSQPSSWSQLSWHLLPARAREIREEKLEYMTVVHIRNHSRIMPKHCNRDVGHKMQEKAQRRRNINKQCNCNATGL